MGNHTNRGMEGNVTLEGRGSAKELFLKARLLGMRGGAVSNRSQRRGRGKQQITAWGEPVCVAERGMGPPCVPACYQQKGFSIISFR
eukprot:260382-Chlamydomonas_euryale.AAC.1